MALRLIKILPPKGFEQVEDIVNDDDIIEYWVEKTDSDHISISILADVELTEKILSDIEDHFTGKSDYRIILLPPMVATGLLVGGGHYNLAMGAALLTVTYIICVNLAGVLTFVLQGIKPKSFTERREGEELSRYAIIIWIALLMLLSLISYYQF